MAGAASGSYPGELPLMFQSWKNGHQVSVLCMTDECQTSSVMRMERLKGDPHPLTSLRAHFIAMEED